MGWILLAAVLAGPAYVLYSAPLAVTAALLVAGAVVALGTSVSNRKRKSRLGAVAADRTGESICDFARSFDARVVDTWIIRAVYEELQGELEDIHPRFPIRAADALLKDLLDDPDDLDMSLVPAIAQRTGRSLENGEGNPHFGQVRSVADLVMFFNAQPYA